MSVAVFGLVLSGCMFLPWFTAVHGETSEIVSTSNTSTGEPPSSLYSQAPDVSQEPFASEQDEAFILFAPLGGQIAYLIDLDGNVVHDWQLSGKPGNSVYLLENGNLLATYTVPGTFQGGGIGGGVQELTWDGAEVWSYQLATEHAHLHHDVSYMPNGNVLMIAWESKTRREALAVDLSVHQLPNSGEVWPEMILEYSPTLDRVVWEWHLWDHALPAGLKASQHPEKIDLAFASNRNSADWWHCNSVDYNEELDQIVLSIRNVSEIWIIDHDLTSEEAAGSAGDLLYRWGNPAAYGGFGPQEFVHQHDAKWLGHERLLIFDNGDPRTRPYSRVVELDLPDYGSSSSSQVLPAQIVWQYPNEQDVSRDILFADHISGAQRLESGNTLICSGTEGRFLEVTPEGDIVWKYVNPYTSTGRDGKESNDVFRAESYSADYIGAVLAYASSSVAQGGPSSSPSQSAQNVGTGQPPVGGLPGIMSVEPTSVQASGGSQLVTITLNPQFAPPNQVQFTNVTIGSIAATSWTRTGDILQAWFTIPSSTPSGSYELTTSFPGREGEPITFSHAIEIR